MESISLHQQSLDHSSTYLQRERWARQQIEDYQAQALHACRAYAYAHSPFYQRFHRGLMDRPLEELPVLTKAMIMEHFDELVTDRAIHLHDVKQYLSLADPTKLFLGRYRVVATSGSTGQPGLFLCNQAEGSTMMDSYIRSQLWGGVTTESRPAMVASVAPAHLSSQLPILNGQNVSPLRLSASHPLETLVQSLNEWQPDVLFLYPSIASVLANEQRQGRLHIALRAIFCAAETLTSETRRRIEETWQTKLFQAYATTESGVLAAECEQHQGLHLFEDFSIVEIVDEQNRPVPPGEQGAKVLITVLYQRTQPLIRYELGDLVRTSVNQCCPCGRPFTLLEDIQGRTAEMLYLMSPTGREEGLTALQFETVIDPLPVSGWQVIHEQDGLHVFLTGVSEELSDQHVLDVLRQMLSRRGVIIPPIEIHRVATLVRNAADKAPMIISRVPSRSSRM